SQGIGLFLQSLKTYLRVNIRVVITIIASNPKNISPNVPLLASMSGFNDTLASRLSDDAFAIDSGATVGLRNSGLTAVSAIGADLRTVVCAKASVGPITPKLKASKRNSSPRLTLASATR